MIRISYVIENDTGIHARPAGNIVKIASEVKSRIKFHKNEKVADAASLFSLLGLGVSKGDVLTVEIEGEDERETADFISNIILCDLQGKVRECEGDYELAVSSPQH